MENDKRMLESKLKETPPAHTELDTYYFYLLGEVPMYLGTGATGQVQYIAHMQI